MKFTLDISGTGNNPEAVAIAVEDVKGINADCYLVCEKPEAGTITFDGVQTKQIAYLIIDTVYGALGRTNPRASNSEILELSMES